MLPKHWYQWPHEKEICPLTERNDKQTPELTTVTNLFSGDSQEKDVLSILLFTLLTTSLDPAENLELVFQPVHITSEMHDLLSQH